MRPADIIHSSKIRKKKVVVDDEAAKREENLKAKAVIIDTEFNKQEQQKIAIELHKIQIGSELQVKFSFFCKNFTQVQKNSERNQNHKRQKRENIKSSNSSKKHFSRRKLPLVKADFSTKRRKHYSFQPTKIFTFLCKIYERN